MPYLKSRLIEIKNAHVLADLAPSGVMWNPESELVKSGVDNHAYSARSLVAKDGIVDPQIANAL